MRVHILAKELNVSSKTIIDKCLAEGITSVKNHMSTLSAGLHATILEWFSEGNHENTVETSAPVDLKKVQIKRKRKAADTGASADVSTEVAELEPTVEEPVEEQTWQPRVAAESQRDVAVAEAPPRPRAVPSVPEPRVTAPTPVAAPTVETRPRAVATTMAPPAPVVEAPPLVQPEVVETKPEVELPARQTVEVKSPPAAEAPVRRKSVAPAGPQNVPTAAKLQGPRVVRYEAPERDLPAMRRGPAQRSPGDPSAIPIPPAPTDRVETEAEKRRRLNPRRATGRLVESGEKLAEWRNRDLEERAERLAGATGRRIHRRRAVHTGGPAQKQLAGPKTQATVHEPVRIKEFCAETGVNFMQIFRVLKEEHNLIANVNMTIPSETAQILALHFGIELSVVPRQTALDEVEAEFAQRERHSLSPRPPVVTMLGHVDHGKTSLLDAIRKTRVVEGEDGGITQHIGSYHIETPHGAVTFLDTPGHAAFTAMRARGAQLTDVVVLVVAADDGLMPQTIEAIRHAQAAEVPIVVALNKIDLGDQNRLKIFGQLSEQGLTPSGDWGGEVDVIPTSATTGMGVVELVEHLADLSGVLELKADPTLPAMGTVLEAETKAGVGAVIRLLVQEGTLRVGDVVVCGNAFGKVRALLDDRGRRIQEASPAIPVEVWGLDDVPVSGDKLYVVDNPQRAKEIASEVKQTRIETARIQIRKALTLEDMFKRRDSDEVPELNVVIKADVDGSLAALRKALSDIPSDEVRLTLRHTAVGPVNDSDILLAATCNGIVVAFRVDVSGGARRMADQHGVEIRPYRIIYEVCDDIRMALSGLLAPEERIEARAKAEVRQVFRMSKIGVIAGCYVVDGVVGRSHLAKVVRDGVVVREGCKFASLKHFKDDVRDVRAGMECGIRLEGFDDIHVGDRIETYEVLKIARTL